MKKLMLLSILLFSILFLSENNSFAQYYFGAKFGWCTPRLSGGNNEISQGYTSRSAINFGLTGSYDFNNNLALQTELNYASQGGKKEGLQAIINPYPNPQLPNPYLYANFKNEAILNYLELPILAKYTFRFSENALKIYVDLGPYAGYLLNAKTKAKGSSYFYSDKSGTQPVTPAPQSLNNDTNITKDIHRFNWGLAGGVGFAKPFGNGDIFLDFRGTYGFINIQKDPANGKNNTGAGIVSIGYAMKID